MSARVKSILLIVATLLIGLLLGALLNARLAEQRMERIASLRSERGFVRYMEDVVAPANEAQREALRDVLHRAGERMAAHQERSRQEARAMLDSTRAELAEILTPEQLQRLDDRMQANRRGRGRRFDGPRGRDGRSSERPIERPNTEGPQ